MSVFDDIRALVSGELPHDGKLLGPCLLSVSGAELIGEEDIVEHFRTAPLRLTDNAFRLETAMHFAVFDTDEAGAAVATVADLYNGNIGRLWRLGPVRDAASAPAAALDCAAASDVAPERRVDVPFDPDLQQLRGDALFRAVDHPELDAAAASHIEAAAVSLARDWQPGEVAAHRTRSFVIRAFSSDDSAVALIARYRQTGGSPRHIGFDYAALRLHFAQDGVPATSIVVGQPAAVGEWSPRL